MVWEPVLCQLAASGTDGTGGVSSNGHSSAAGSGVHSGARSHAPSLARSAEHCAVNARFHPFTPHLFGPLCIALLLALCCAVLQRIIRADAHRLQNNRRAAETVGAAAATGRAAEQQGRQAEKRGNGGREHAGDPSAPATAALVATWSAGLCPHTQRRSHPPHHARTSSICKRGGSL